MTRFECLYEFSPTGLTAFEKAFAGHMPEGAINPRDTQITQIVTGTRSLEVREFATAADLARAIVAALGTRAVTDTLTNTGLWAWLAFVLRDVLFPIGRQGTREIGEIYRWLPSDPNDYQKAQRHLVRMPVTLLATLGRNADHLLCGKPSIHGEVREQLTSQQEMFHPGFQAVARALYFDDATHGLKRGAGGKGPGSPRKLARVRKQFDVTWDLFAIPPNALLQMLPKEFDRFKPASMTSTAYRAARRDAQGELTP